VNKKLGVQKKISAHFARRLYPPLSNPWRRRCTSASVCSWLHTNYYLSLGQLNILRLLQNKTSGCVVTHFTALMMNMWVMGKYSITMQVIRQAGTVLPLL